MKLLRLLGLVFILSKDCLGTTCWETGICSGVPMNIFDSDNIEECLNRCQDIYSCKWFSFRSYPKKCYLFESCPNLDTCDSCTSGERTCHSERPTNSIIVIGGMIGTGEATNNVQIIDITNGTIKDAPVLPYSLAMAAGGVVDGILTVCGGESIIINHVIKHDQCIQYVNQQWVKVAQMKHERLGFGAAVVPNIGLWLMGGCDSNGIGYQHSEIFKDGALHDGPKLPWESEMYTGICKFCSFQLNDTKTFIGGGVVREINGVHDSTQAKIYNWETQSWKELAPMNHPRSDCSGGIYNGKIIIVGGISGQKETVEIYDLASDTWTLGPDLPGTLSEVEVVSSGDRLFLTGGKSYKDHKYYGSIYEYFPEGWVLVSEEINPKRIGHVSFFMPKLTNNN